MATLTTKNKSTNALQALKFAASSKIPSRTSSKMSTVTSTSTSTSTSNANDEDILINRLNKIPVDGNDPNRTTQGVVIGAMNDFESVINEITSTYINIIAKIASVGIKSGANAAVVDSLAMVYAVDDLVKTGADIIENQFPVMVDSAGKIAEGYTEGMGKIDTIIKTSIIKVKEAAKEKKAEIKMASHPELTKEQAIKEVEEDERIEEENARKEKEMDLEMEKAKAVEAQAEVTTKKAEAIETAMEAKIIAASGGGKRRVDLNHIQKGGRMSARRTQKSIKDFLKPSITASSILKIVKGGKKGVKKSVKKRKI
jgi:hypothetical protein